MYLRRALMTVLVILLVGPLVVGRSLYVMAVCPDPQFLSTVGLDGTQIVNDSITGDKALIGKLYAYTNQPLVITGHACDPDNDDPNYPPQTLKVWCEPEMAELPLDPTGNYEFTVQYPTNGWHYKNVVVTDGVMTRTATIAIYTRTNKPPTLGCGGLTR